MKYDVFFSISQRPVDGHTPDEATMLKWVKDSLGTTEVAAVEASLKTEVDLQTTPVEALGVAF